MRAKFQEYGEIRDVYLPLEFHTRKPRGFGFVEFLDSGNAREAMEALDGSDLDGNTITVMVAEQRRKSVSVWLPPFSCNGVESRVLSMLPH